MKHAATSQKQRNQVMEVAMTIPLWLVIATCLTFTYKLFLINSSLQEQSKMGTLTFQYIMGNTLHPDLCTVLTAPQEQDKPQWRLQKKKKTFPMYLKYHLKYNGFMHVIISQGLEEASKTSKLMGIALLGEKNIMLHPILIDGS